jgi:hypothetical protein
MPVPPSFLVTSIAVLMLPPMFSMPSVEQVQERAKQQQDIRENSKYMRLVFFPEEKGRDGEKPEKRKSAS